jgi:Zn-dependent peptidase ImmA (M78 family)
MTMTLETIEYALLPVGVAGYWDRESDVIVINALLTPRSRRATIEHERIHRERGDEKCLNSWADKKQELAVEREAARRLIPLGAIIDGLRWSLDHRELAELWDVDVHMVCTRMESLTAEEKTHIGRFLDSEEQLA